MNAPLPVIESAVVMPSIGDDVLFQLNGVTLTSPRLAIINPELPVHAKVVHVWGPAMVNLVLWDHYGHMHTLTSVKFLPPGEEVPVGQTYCELAVISGELIEGEPLSIRMTAQEEHELLQRLKDIDMRPHKLEVQAAHTSDLVGTVEQAIVQAGADKAPRVTTADVEDNIVAERYFSAEDGAHASNRRESSHFNGVPITPELRLLTFCVLTLRNGFLVTGESACASSENFNAEIGRRIARENAVAKIWPLMGYELRTKLAAS